MNKILDFWKRNSTFILTMLGFLFFMDFCGRMIMPKHQMVNQQEPELHSNISEGNTTGKGLKSYEEIMMERSVNQKSKLPLLSLLFALLTVGATGYYVHKKGYLKKIIPGSIGFKAILLKEKTSKRLLMRINLSNTTHETQTFLPLSVLFKKSSEVRRFRLKSDDFPLSLTPGTKHTLVIDIEKFREKLPELNRYSRIGAEIDTTSGKIYKSNALPKWLIF